MMMMMMWLVVSIEKQMKEDFESKVSEAEHTINGMKLDAAKLQKQLVSSLWLIDRYMVILYYSTISLGWHSGSVFTTSVFGWRTFPDLCLIYGWHVTSSWVRCLPWINQPGQCKYMRLQQTSEAVPPKIRIFQAVCSNRRLASEKARGPSACAEPALWNHQNTDKL